MLGARCSGISILLLSAFAVAQARDVTDRFAAPVGQRVTLWAESPHLFNPTAIDVDVRGRIWVAEAVNYRKWRGRNPGRTHADGDRIVILEDRDGDGACDSSTVFAQDEDLVAPLGIAVIGDRVFVACSPNLFVYRDTDGDDVADEREVFLSGFGGFNHDHGLHSPVLGPDGSLYFNAGNAGPHVVTDRDGWTLRAGSIYVGGGPERAPNKPGLESDDGRVWSGGIVMRVGADGRGLRVLAHNFRNPYEVAVDAFGDLWQSDNDDDGNRGCRTMWVMPGGDFGFFGGDGSRRWQADKRPGQEHGRAQWHADDPGVAPPGCMNGAGGPTGVAIYESGLLSDDFRGAVLNCDAGASVVYAHRPKPSGSGFELEKSDLIRSKPGEKARWFRPSDVAVGAEGAVYVADWWDPGVGGHAARDREGYGRILRIAPADAPKRARPRRVESAESALAALASPAVHVRAAAQSWFLANGPAGLRDLVRGAGDDRLRARALWLLARCGDDAFADEALALKREMLRLVALRAWPDRAASMVDDPSPLIRREVAYLVREQPVERRLPLLLRLAERYPVGDRFYLESLGDAARGLEEELFVQLLSAAEPDPEKWDDRLAEIVWRLHPPSSVPALMRRVMATQLAREQRSRSLTALAFIPTRRAAESMLSVAEAGPADTRSDAFWWVKNRDTNDWSEFGLGHRLGGDRKAAKQLFASGVMREGARDVDVEIAGCDTIWLVVNDGGDGISCDWADWIDPKLSGPAGEISLLEHGWVQERVGWGSVGRNVNAGGAPLRVDGRQFERGIGLHAASEITVRVPRGFGERFTAVVGPDHGGTSQQQGRDTSIEFRVFGAAKAGAGDVELQALAAQLLDADGSEAGRSEAAGKLAATAQGGSLLVSMAAAGKLDARAKALVAGTIFRTPDAGVRALASRYFERPGRSSDPLPPIDIIARMSGDARRGEALFFGSKAGCSACHVMGGRGGEIGPELTGIRGKLDALGLTDAVLNPSAAIAFGYDSWILEMKEGTLHSGYVLADGAKVVLKDLAGTRIVVDAADIVSRTKQSVSLMPEVAALGLSAQEIADLNAFMLSVPGGAK